MATPRHLARWLRRGHALLHPGPEGRAHRSRRALARLRHAMREAATQLGAAGHEVAERLSYRPREVGLVALLASGLVVGLGVEQWRQAHPALVRQLEFEPPRLAVVAPAPRWRPRTPAPVHAPDCSGSDRPRLPVRPSDGTIAPR